MLIIYVYAHGHSMVYKGVLQGLVIKLHKATRNLALRCPLVPKGTPQTAHDFPLELGVRSVCDSRENNKE